MEEDAEAFVFVVRELVFLDADNPVGLSELGFVPVQGRDVNSRDLDRKVLIGCFWLSFLVLWFVVVCVGLFFPVRVEICSFFEERGLRVGWWPRGVCWNRW